MLEVRTGCRLHFGLLELAKDQELRFGGLGLMLEHPGWRLRFSQAVDSRFYEEHSRDEVQIRIEHAQLRAGQPKTNCSVYPTERLVLHTGLGAGTQLACAVALGELLIAQLKAEKAHESSNLHEHLSNAQRPGTWTNIHDVLPSFDLNALATRSGRGLRSAIGLCGFLHGGFILDHGYDLASQGSLMNGRPITASVAHWPEEWRAVLILPASTAVISGEQEAKMLHEIGLKPNPHRLEMYELATTALSLVQSSTSFEAVMELIERYTQLAAQLFAAQQGGAYNGPHVTEAVQSAKRAGLRGVGQSSWGPTVFGFAANDEQAKWMVDAMRQEGANWAISICRPSQHGAQWRMVNDVPAY